LDAKFGFKSSGSVVDAGVNNTTVVTALMSSWKLLNLSKNNINALKYLQLLECNRVLTKSSFFFKDGKG
jgi:hypothetical protein